MHKNQRSVTNPRFAWIWKLAQLAALATTAVVLVEWVPAFFRHYGINWKAVTAAVGLPAVTGLYNLAQSHLRKVQAANEQVQLENAKHIVAIEDRVDSIVLQLSRFNELNRIDNDVMSRISQLQIQLDAHEQQYGHPLLWEDFRGLQRTVEELRAIAYRLDRLIQLTAEVEEIQKELQKLRNRKE